MKKLLILMLLLSGLLACNSVSTRSRGEGLVNTIDEYVAALRWGRFDRAAQYHMEKDGTHPDIDTSQLEYIRVTGHKMKNKTVNESIDEATVDLELQYYHNEYGTLKKTVVQQIWWYSEEAKGWFLSSEFPHF